MPLTFATMGKECTITRCNFEGDTKRHLESMGFIIGEKVIPLAENGGSIIVKVKESRLALNMGIASRIQVN